MVARRIAAVMLGFCVVCTAVFVVLAWRRPISAIAQRDLPRFEQSLVRHGGELAKLGNCAVCHTAPGGKALAGGRALPTPFGTIYSTNITPDSETGIGRWSEAAFRRAMREGVDRSGRHLYPAFPYDHFTVLTDDDNKALYAYLMSRDPIHSDVPANELRFPFNVRLLLAGWKLLFLRTGPYRPDPAQNREWNRGAYLVEGLAHCGACHTPRNSFGAEKKGEQFDGGEAEGWTAYALNHASPAPVPWSPEALYFYLRNGWHEAHGLARGPMAPVVDNLSSVADLEVRAIATYMASVLGEPTPERRRQGEALLAQSRNAAASDNPVAGDSEATTEQVHAGAVLGEAIYAAACANCHESARPLPFGGIHLALSTGVHGPNPHNVINVIVSGLPAAEGERSPIMPGFSAALDDDQLVQLLAYLRSRFSDKPQWSDIANDVRAARAGRRPIGFYPSPAMGTAPADASQREQP